MDDGSTGFGAQLRRYREGAGLTQEALAERAGLAASAIAALERGRRRRPHPQTVRRLAAALQLDAEQRALFEAAGRLAGGPPGDGSGGRAGGDRDGTAAGPPPPPPPPPTNLPAPRTVLIGREGEVADLADLLTQAGARLVTLTGVGGVGKTRVALQAAGDLREAFPGGVWLVELAPVADPALVPHTVATTLGVREAPGTPLLDGLVVALRPRAVLLVLDNCEHVVGACARLAQRLLDACPELRLLTTSREPLQIAGEQQRRVPPLPVPDPGEPRSVEDLARNPAVRLFVERAQAAAPAFRLTAESAAAVAGVCVRLDGLPLALELAAARVPVLAVEQIRARLDDSLRLLTGGSRAGPDRQQTLRATLGWSHALLTGPERALFRRLAPFAGGFDLGAAEAVCAGDGLAGEDVLDALGRLIAKSLVMAEGGNSGAGRYRLLEPVRQYAAARLAASGEAPAVRGRHRDWYLALVEGAAPSLQGTERAVWLGRLEAEHDNLRAALRWSVDRGEAEPGLRMAVVLGAVGARGGLWYLHGYLSEGQSWLEALLALPGAAPRSALRARALAAAGNLAAFRGDDATAKTLTEEALGILREQGDRQGVADALYVWSTPLWWRGDYAGARAALAESLAAFRETGDRQMASITLTVQGYVAFAAGDLAAARALSEEALLAQRELGHTVGLQFSLHNLGQVAQEEGDPAAARARFAEALEVNRRAGQTDGLGMSLFHLGDVALDQGDLAAARAWFAESLHVYRRTGSKQRLAIVLEGVAGLAAAALREATGTRYLPPLPARLERRLEPARAALSREAQEAIWAGGREMPYEQAVAEALAAVEDDRDDVALTAGVSGGSGSRSPLQRRPPDRSHPPRPPRRHRRPRDRPPGRGT